ncbi:c-type cytochrome [Novosphingobium sp. JCM 18896]|uniref:c-type cytochrome n=1 Tax=Novosphingobium sp. JCM 18896 TaxID=2989731 RepID=UPI0022229CA8|nr:c-type cytochrome [Novosphingobium sp. JCM 18896]MCW1429484.1 c-type cytochrome [Novosphingobium sp. JCM 18896]
MTFRRSIIAIVASTLFAMPALAAGPDGEAVFRQRCQSCHGTPQRPSPLGPNLTGVVGRKAASTPFAYSPALKASGLTWNRATLDRFLTAPARTVPGTRMVISLTDPAQRAAVLDYLATRR